MRDVGLVEQWKFGMHSSRKNIKPELWFFTYLFQSENQITFICRSQLALPKFSVAVSMKSIYKVVYIFKRSPTQPFHESSQEKMYQELFQSSDFCGDLEMVMKLFV